MAYFQYHVKGEALLEKNRGARASKKRGSGRRDRGLKPKGKKKGKEK